MILYCTDPNCGKKHCKWGKEGKYKKHEEECILKHCYNCYSHKILVDKQGFVLSWFCSEECKNKYHLPNTQQ
ncbi:MAG: hypothetical protein AABY22_10630 [Nanoarchaeota archaeon]